MIPALDPAEALDLLFTNVAAPGWRDRFERFEALHRAYVTVAYEDGLAVPA